MMKSKVLAATLAAAMFATAACGLVACGDGVASPDKQSKTYTVTFDADGGTLTGSKTLKTNENGIVTGTTPTATKADNTFTGWSLTKGSTTKINFTSQKFTKNTTVYAMYTSNGVTGDEYTITFMYGEGSGTPATAPTTNGKLAELPTPTAPDGKKFDGWFTAATGGTAVTTNTTFTGDDSIYAQYSDNQQVVVSDNYAMVGTQKYELEVTRLANAEQAFFLSVDLTEGDTISFYVDGEVISAWPGSVWNGLEAETTKKTEFTAVRTGLFEFNIGYYPANVQTGAKATWSIDGNDGVIAFHAYHYYLVGKEYGNWEKCLEEWYLGELSGEVDITVGNAPVTFKLAKCGNEYSGAISWDGALGSGDVSKIGRGYVSSDKDGNIVLKAAGTYTVRLNNGQIEITSADVEEPEITINVDGYTYGPIDSAKHYLVGGFIGMDFDAQNGYEMKTKINGDGDVEYMVEGFTVEAGGAVKIVIDGAEYGYENIHEQWGQKNLATAAEDGSIVFKAYGSYKIYFNPKTGAIYLSK